MKSYGIVHLMSPEGQKRRLPVTISRALREAILAVLDCRAT